MRTITIGVDLAKQVFSLCSVDAAGRVQERRELRRDAFIQWLPSVPAGTTVAKKIKFRIQTCRPVTFSLTGLPVVSQQR